MVVGYLTRAWDHITGSGARREAVEREKGREMTLDVLIRNGLLTEVPAEELLDLIIPESWVAYQRRLDERARQAHMETLNLKKRYALVFEELDYENGT